MEILLVEDNVADAYLTKTALQNALPESRVSTVHDGEKALDFMHREGAYTDVVRPDLIILDLNLPRIDGFGVLTYLKASPVLRTIPVVVLSTSTWEGDIDSAYALGAYYYLGKPFDFDQYLALGYAIAELWQRWRQANLASVVKNTSQAV